jgi:uncharacterized membrane-anchored protein YjiN (DUF445 family)
MNSTFAGQIAPPSLARSSRLAMIALVSAAVLWIVFLVLARALPHYSVIFEILAQGAEAGVVGGLADWYAVTVLFRNPFGRIPLPALLQEHTEIIPRNKARIALSMGRFVQENFLAPPIVRKSLRATDVSMKVGEWLAKEENAEKLTGLLQRMGPRLLQVFESKEIEAFIQQNAVEWVKSTPMHHSFSALLRAVLENDFHHEALQRGLDAADNWIKENPEKAYLVTRRILEELGVGGLARGASWIGIDVQQKVINTFMSKVEKLLADREHPWRVALEQLAADMMKSLRKRNSPASQKLNAAKNALADSASVVNFITGAVIILREAIKHDLQRKDSGLASNAKGILLRLGQHLQTNERVRDALNREIEEAAVAFTTDYSDAIILYVSQHIHDWDTRDMISKIETEVGGDLHMIRVNGVVVGSFIGLALGLGRALIGHVPI